MFSTFHSHTGTYLTNKNKGLLASSGGGGGENFRFQQRLSLLQVNIISDSLGLPPGDKEEILATASENPLQQLQQEFSSVYKIGRRVESSDFYIAPVTVKLPPTASGDVPTFQMVPLTKLVPAIAAQPAFRSAAPSPDHLHDIVDGCAFKDNPFFKVGCFQV